MRRFILIASAAFLAAPAAAAPAPALLVEGIPTAAFRIGDLDLASTSGQRRFDQRLNLALEEVCGSYAGSAIPHEEERVTACRAAGTASARAQLATRLADRATSTIRIAARGR